MRVLQQQSLQPHSYYSMPPLPTTQRDVRQHTAFQPVHPSATTSLPVVIPTPQVAPTVDVTAAHDYMQRVAEMLEHARAAQRQTEEMNE